MSDKPGHFDICKEMCRRSMDIRMAPLDNCRTINYSEKRGGTEFTIGMPGNLCFDGLPWRGP